MKCIFVSHKTGSATPATHNGRTRPAAGLAVCGAEAALEIIFPGDIGHAGGYTAQEPFFNRRCREWVCLRLVHLVKNALGSRWKIGERALLKPSSRGSAPSEGKDL